jgi:tRNA dimethylallyltransferase
MTKENKPKIVVIAGPTASGKTNLARFLAETYNGEIISADSRQVYRGLDIGTGKEGELRQKIVPDSTLNAQYPTKRFIGEIPQWLIDVADPQERYTVADWQQAAYAVIDDIVQRGKLPIVVGGTGLYVAALIGGYSFDNEKRSTANARHADPEGYKKNPPDWEVLQLAIDLPREALYERINKRLNDRIEQGLIAEGEKLMAELGEERLRQFGLEYRYLADLLSGELNAELFEERLAGAIRQYARRQLTWFRNHGPVLWVENQEQAAEAVERFITG